MNKNIIITIVGITIASIGLVFALTSSQGNVLPRGLENNVYEEWEIIQIIGCQETYPSPHWDSEQHCMNSIKQCLIDFPQSTSFQDCFNRNALHDPKP